MERVCGYCKHRRSLDGFCHLINANAAINGMVCESYREANGLVEDKTPKRPWSMEEKIIYTVDLMKDVLIKKNKDYGNSFEKTLEKYGDTALMLRLEDKMNRLERLFKSGEQNVEDESFTDTVRDLAGYCLLWLAVKERRDANDAEV